MYLRSVVSWLTEAQAKAYEVKGWVVYDRGDGYWTAVYLVDKPVQHGQHPWVG
jgi:hypothetical protein